MMPYAQKLVSDYLRDQLDGVRVVSKPPGENSRTTAWVQVSQIDVNHNTSDPTDKQLGFYFQFDSYAGREGGMPEAERLSRQVHALIVAMEGQFDAPTELDDPVVVSGTQVTAGPRSAPDTDGFEPARDRFLMDAVIYAHTRS